ncbi:sulfatase [Kineosporia sp. J2-2]|uniref:Sulfatase n=1 Tax=Kineosporia corallincola TaxID=2835133 RepID=A0ABS5TLZ2_9ACTN|nr:sulfatase [Kineosporia corallincola]MBT0771191.1 sulfatase [Kineosporia corallincola]
MTIAPAVLLTVLLAGLPACSAPAPDADARPTRTAQDPNRPNLVFVLTDDLSMNLLKYLPAVRQMQREGTTFSRYFATDSLCCPSRVSIFSGRYPHSTGIYRNVGDDGGYLTFKARGLERDTMAADLQKAGYRTAMMGKYLNQYQPGTPRRPRPVPPGWNEWAVAGYGYNGFDYNLNQTGQVVHHGTGPGDYITDVLSGLGQDFIRRAAAENQPFMLEIAPFMPHAPYIPAPRHANEFAGLKAPRTRAYGATTRNAPSWLKRYRLTARDRAGMDRDFRLRAQAVQAVDEMVAALRQQLEATGTAGNTYLVFSSDNGYHMGEHALTSGKTTAFDTDIRVPFVVVGPDVPAGQTVNALASNIDVRPTFGALAGARVPAHVEGQNLAPLWRGGSSRRQFVLVEHHGPVTNRKDPDYPLPAGGNPPDYEAMRGKDWLYVLYRGGEQEYYDMTRDPHQLNNIAGSVSKKRLRRLKAVLRRAEACSGGASCARAQRAGR